MKLLWAWLGCYALGFNLDVAFLAWSVSTFISVLTVHEVPAKAAVSNGFPNLLARPNRAPEAG
jgi:hypothetical protein